jgi:ABC-type transporter Mla subunit MlaD
VDGAVNEDWPDIATDLKSTAANLADASMRVDTLLERNDANVDRLLGEGLDDVTDLAANLRTVTDELSRLAARLREDPSRLIFRSKRDPVVAEP